MFLILGLSPEPSGTARSSVFFFFFRTAYGPKMGTGIPQKGSANITTRNPRKQCKKGGQTYKLFEFPEDNVPQHHQQGDPVWFLQMGNPG